MVEQFLNTAPYSLTHTFDLAFIFEKNVGENALYIEMEANYMGYMDLDISFIKFINLQRF